MNFIIHFVRRGGVIPEPIYYLGWCIQASPKGWWVYQRNDTVRPVGKLFQLIEEAYNFIDSEIDKQEV